MEEIYEIERKIFKHREFSKYCLLEYDGNDGNDLDERTESGDLANPDDAECSRPLTPVNIFWADYEPTDFLASFDESVFDIDIFEEVVDILSETNNPAEFPAKVQKASEQTGACVYVR